MTKQQAAKLCAWINQHDPATAHVDADTNVIIMQAPWVKMLADGSREEGFDTILITSYQQARAELGY